MYIKYPRTPHLPWSGSCGEDDKRLVDTGHFAGHEVVVTEKLDGENTTMYRDHLHARSMDSKDHPSRHRVKALHGAFRHELPEGWRLCGENVFAKHSILYTQLPSYFLVFNLWNEQDVCLSHDETAAFAQRLGLQMAPVLYRGIWDEQRIKRLYTGQSVYGGEQEGYVVRRAGAFARDDFKHHLAKFVRPNHVQTNEHWLNQAIVPNILQR